METLTPSLHSRSTEEKPSSFPSPIKAPSTAAASSPSRHVPSDQIETPEKPIELPRRTQNRSVAFSVKQVKEIALGLQRSDKGSIDRADLDGSNDDLISLEKQIGVSSDRDRLHKAKTLVKLPEKYQMLGELFNYMESSIRLLQLKGSKSTFSNISTKIEYLTDRRFTYGHLAQLKYILPEAISIRKVLVHDETTCCMKPELQVNLLIGALGNTTTRQVGSGYSILRKAFRARLVEFCRKHPEGDDVPEETLPGPFNLTKPSMLSNMAKPSTFSLSVESSPHALCEQQFIVPSHMSQSFKNRFSHKVPIPNTEKTPLTCSDKASPKNGYLDSFFPSPIKCSLKPHISTKSLFSFSDPLPLSSTCGTPEEQEVKNLTKSDNCSPKKLNILEGTPAKLVSTPAKLMTITPGLQTPKRCCLTPDYDSPPLKKSTKRSVRIELFPTPTKNKNVEDKENEIRSSLVDDDDDINFLPESLLQSVREKERKAMEEQEALVAKEKRRQQMIAHLPKLFDMILLIFQSWRRSVITKQELLHKLIASHCEIVDRNEVEEQLNLLQELVPDWISGRMASSGDFLCCVNKLSSPEDIRERLVRAK